MLQSKRRRKKSSKRILALPDLEHAKTTVLNSLTSTSGQRTYDHAIREFVGWYCSEPRLAFNRTVVLRYRIHLEQRHYAPATINLRLAGEYWTDRKTKGQMTLTRRVPDVLTRFEDAERVFSELQGRTRPSRRGGR
jgi:hypothetical protein